MVPLLLAVSAFAAPLDPHTGVVDGGVAVFTFGTLIHGGLGSTTCGPSAAPTTMSPD